MYKQKGKTTRESVVDITPSNESHLLNTLKMDVENEIKNMTLEKGTKLLEEPSVMIFPGLDLISALVFDSFLHNNDSKHKLSLEGVT